MKKTTTILFMTVLLTISIVSASLKITEVWAPPTGVDKNYEFIELTNDGSSSVTIPCARENDGWSFTHSEPETQYHFLCNHVPSVTLSPDESVVFARNAGLLNSRFSLTSNDCQVIDYRDSNTDQSNDEAEVITIYNAPKENQYDSPTSANIVDSLNYGAIGTNDAAKSLHVLDDGDLVSGTPTPCSKSADSDGDGILDHEDNCLDLANPGQENYDGDEEGDACDSDDDNDGVLDNVDNCHFDYNPNQENNDLDSEGDVCDPDDDNDGTLDVNDACVFIRGLADRQGCPVGDRNIVQLHIIDQAKIGVCPGGAGSCKKPLEGVEVRVFDRNNAAFQLKYGTKNPSGTVYDQVFENNVGIVGKCTTAANGICIAGEEKIGDYLVILKYVDDASIVYTGKPKGLSDFTADGMATKDFQIIKTIKRDGSIDYKGGSKVVVTGSYLEIIYPEAAIWEGTSSIYPFIFTSDSEWDVDICASLPEGYKIVGDQCQQVFVSGESKYVLFEGLEVGSPEPHMKAKLKIKHKGKPLRNIDLEIPGKRKAKGKNKLTGAVVAKKPNVVKKAKVSKKKKSKSKITGASVSKVTKKKVAKAKKKVATGVKLASAKSYKKAVKKTAKKAVKKKVSKKVKRKNGSKVTGASVKKAKVAKKAVKKVAKKVKNKLTGKAVKKVKSKKRK